MIDIKRRFSFFLMRHPEITTVSEFSSTVLPEKRGRLIHIAKDGQKSISKGNLLYKPKKPNRISSKAFPKELKVWKQLYLRNAQMKPYHKDYGSPEYKPPPKEKYDGETFYVYTTYILEILIKNKVPLFLFATPFNRMLGHTIDNKVEALSAEHANAERVSFAYLDLTDFCRSFITYRNLEDIAVTRVELKTEGTLHLERIILYGSNALRSDEYQGLKGLSSPQSIRIATRYSPLDNPFFVSADNFGNWSFYFSKRDELAFVSKIVNFLNQKNLLNWSFAVPHRRKERKDNDT